MNACQTYDVLIIGSGVSGLALALILANHHKVALVSKANLADGSSPHAQGGIAAVMNADDSLEDHMNDTLAAGAGLCHRDVVEFVVKQGKVAIEWLMKQGVHFTHLPHQPQKPHLNREGGHSHRRILHVADKTGAAVVDTIAQQVKQHSNIDCWLNCMALDLMINDNHCDGAWILAPGHTDPYCFFSKITVLATGGASGCYRYTTNSNQTSGDGIAMAWRAGASVANLEFNQFHPTTLYDRHAPGWLISEAVRGEGGILTLPNGERFMPRYDPRAEMAPRDIVARAIDHEIKIHQSQFVLLDISHKPASDIQRLFPTIYQHCLALGLDMTKQPIPVVPAVHYTCGGVVTDLYGATNVKSLYAIGEVACTGLHGANRMASNSLLECLVFAMSAGQQIHQQLTLPYLKPVHLELTEPLIDFHASDSNLEKTIADVRQIMWDKVGIVRCNQDLKQAKKDLDVLSKRMEGHNQRGNWSVQLIECRNILLVARLTVACAQRRHESRGLHYNTDYLHLLKQAFDTILDPKKAKLKDMF